MQAPATARRAGSASAWRWCGASSRCTAARSTARSEGTGRGTEIRVGLPLAPRRARRRRRRGTPQVDAEPLPPQARRRILVADDNDDAAGSLALRLELAGHEVRTAQDGLEALAVARTFQPEVVLLDLGMPAMDGYETARHLRRLAWGKQARLIALTGWGQQQDRIRTAEAGFDVHLVKPVSELDLFQAIAASEPIGAGRPDDSRLIARPPLVRRRDAGRRRCAVDVGSLARHVDARSLTDVNQHASRLSHGDESTRDHGRERRCTVRSRAVGRYEPAVRDTAAASELQGQSWLMC